ncbi:MAG TPA: UDP-3-O-(3-hydroxymyristoyl)glucosamine N-acyltransferase [Bacteroidales bacterium]|nr:UDP-3-O-(3-hydroxymyristoyl)glucosamine N-acyltransferase [Bacteroidales bacterium]
MKFKAKDIAQAVGGTVAGNPEVEVHTLAKIEEGVEGAISFLANPKYTPHIYTTRASVVIVSHDFEPEQPLGCTLVRVADPYGAFATLLELYNSMQVRPSGISSLAFVHPEASIAEECYVGEFAWIGPGVYIGKGCKLYPGVYLGDHVRLGEGCTLYPGVKVYHDCIVGNECTIHAGSVIGADGFGFAPQEDNQYRKVAQIGNVILEDRVEIGANTTVDRATLGSTIIRRGVKLDNLIQVAHNVEIGENTVIAAQTGIAGSTRIGKNCMIAGQVGIVGHATVADEVKVAAQSGISGSVRNKGSVVMGSPAFDHALYVKAYIAFRKLPDHLDRIRELEERLKALEARLPS